MIGFALSRHVATLVTNPRYSGFVSSLIACMILNTLRNANFSPGVIATRNSELSIKIE